MASAKMTANQKNLLLEWLEKPENRWVMWTSSREYPSYKIKRKWEEIAEILNNCRFGTKKGPDKWRKTFVELRSHIKKKYRTQIAQKKSGKAHPYIITETEQRFANIFRLGEGKGDEEEVPHAPCDSPEQIKKAEDETVWSTNGDDNISEQSSSTSEQISPKKEKIDNEQSQMLNSDSLKLGECNHPQREAELVTKSWAVKLNRMNSDQRLLAEKFINDIIFEGEMANLHRNAIRFNIQGDRAETYDS